VAQPVCRADALPAFRPPRGAGGGRAGEPRMKWLGACLLALGVAAAGSALGQKAAEPERVRGTVARVDASSMVIQLKDGNSVRVALAQNLAVFSLSRGSFADLDF